MWLRIKELFHDSFFYGASKFLGQIIGFLLIPLYTVYLLPADFGIATVLSIYSVSMTLISNIGLDSSLYNFLGLSKKDSQHNQIAIDTASIFVLFVSVLFLLINIVSSKWISFLLLKTSDYYVFVIVSSLIAFADSISVIPLNVLRINRDVRKVSISSLLNVVFSVLFTLIFVVWLKWGVLGFLLGNFIGSVGKTIYLFIYVSFPKIVNFKNDTLTALAKVALYLFPNKVFALSLPYYSQYILSRELSLSALGLYAVAWKFCLPFNTLVGIFQQSWAPYKFEVFKTSNDPKKFFSDFFTVYVLGILSIYLGTVLFGDSVLRLMTNSIYHEAGMHLKYLALIPLFNGLYFMLSSGYEFSTTQKWRPWITFAGLLGVIILTHLTVSKFGIMGASISIAFGWLIMAVLIFIAAYRLYPIQYNWKVVIFLTVSVVISLYLNQYATSFWSEIVLFFLYLGSATIAYTDIRKKGIPFLLKFLKRN